MCPPYDYGIYGILTESVLCGKQAFSCIIIANTANTDWVAKHIQIASSLLPDSVLCVCVCVHARRAASKTAILCLRQPCPGTQVCVTVQTCQQETLLPGRASCPSGSVGMHSTSALCLWVHWCLFERIDVQ